MSQLKNPARGPPLRGAGCRHDTGVMETQRIMRQDIKNSLIPLCIPLSSYFSLNIKYDLISPAPDPPWPACPHIPPSSLPYHCQGALTMGAIMTHSIEKYIFFNWSESFLFFHFTHILAKYLEHKKLKIHENWKNVYGFYDDWWVEIYSVNNTSKLKP